MSKRRATLIDVGSCRVEAKIEGQSSLASLASLVHERVLPYRACRLLSRRSHSRVNAAGALCSDVACFKAHIVHQPDAQKPNAEISPSNNTKPITSGTTAGAIPRRQDSNDLAGSPRHRLRECGGKRPRDVFVALDPSETSSSKAWRPSNCHLRQRQPQEARPVKQQSPFRVSISQSLCLLLFRALQPAIHHALASAIAPGDRNVSIPHQPSASPSSRCRWPCLVLAY